MKHRKPSNTNQAAAVKQYQINYLSQNHVSIAPKSTSQAIYNPMNDLHILIPSLLSPLTLWHKDFLFTPKSSLLSVLLAHADYKKQSHIGLDRSLFSLLNYPEQQELPSAYYRYQLDFSESPTSAIMCADPVHLDVGIDEIILSPEPIDDLSPAEYIELVENLNQHFAQDNWHFLVAKSGHCYLQYQNNEQIQTTPLDVVRSKSIFNYLPQSENLNWHSLQNEIQMLLHMTSLNQSREMAGQRAINSLWFWGAAQAQTLQHTINAIWGGGVAAQIAAKAAKISHHKKIDDYSDLNSGQHIVVFDQLYAVALNDQYSHWQTTLDDLENNQLIPLLQSAKKQKKTVHIHDCNGHTFTLRPPKRQWKFWQKSVIELHSLAKKIQDK